ncbi:ABC transporter ATP-binding protein [Aristaeella hokkaidonensis]|uniref:ABC transporter ATP-binding protein n=1 Tax=Aristaeella hokkaidonensis TaxID=3046382 RepID=A0AC61N5Q5_9FIRM|nr:ABC transporter ATP-binding protein [Aristaeella hokkaidonensis]QUC68610.1 ABC transporter ATP-binding protein [Aristaeella hokkaidonensis]
MLHITKRFPGIIANDDITLQLKHGEIHALLGENGAGKSTLMSVLFGLYQAEEGTIKKDGKEVQINDPNDANALGIGMVHQHFKLVECFTVLDNIILGDEPVGKAGILKKAEARKKILALSEKYGLQVDPDAVISDITVGMQQRTEILKMLYRDNEILIFDEPTAVLTPQEIEELMQIMRNLAAEGKSILFISHKLAEIMAVADRCTVLRKGKYIGTVETKNTTMEELSAMMVGRNVNFHVDKQPAHPGEVVLDVQHMTVASKVHNNNAVKDVSFQVRRGEIVCIAGIDGNGQTELVYGLTGLEPLVGGKIMMDGKDITHASIRKRSVAGMSHIPEDRHKHGLVLDYSLEYNMILQTYFESRFTDRIGFLRRKNIREYSDKLIEQYDVRSGQGSVTPARSMSGGNQQKAIIAREIDKQPEMLVAVQPTRGLDVGAIEYIHKQLVAQRDAGKAVLLISLELDEVMDVPDRILVMYEGEIVGELDPKKTTQEELGLYMAGAKRDEVKKA